MEAILRKEIIVNKTACRIIGVAAFVVLTALGAFVRLPLPFTPVPVTLQTFFVLLGACFLGKSLGSFAQASYLVLGACGVPFFAGSNIGLAYLFGPTGGYLLSFVLASFLVGKTISFAKGNFLKTFSILFMADYFILLCGSLWLKSLLGFSFSKALFLGFLPFIAGDILKVLLATAIYLKFKARIQEVF